MNLKIQKSIIQNLEKIVHKQFEERDIKELLIDSRNFLQKNSLPKEIAHFIAHADERDQGICHQDINYTYYLTHLHFVNNFQQKHNPEWVFNIYQVSDALFQNIIIPGIKKDRPNKHWINLIGLNQKEIADLLEKNYKVDEEKKVRVLTSLIHIVKIETIFKEILFRIPIKPVFNIENVAKEWFLTLMKVADSVDFKLFTKSIFEKIKKDLSICFLSLLQDARFKMSNGDIVKSHLAIDTYSSKQPTKLNETLGILVDINIQNEKKDITIVYKIIDSDIPYQDYIDKESFVHPLPHFKRLPYSIAKRNKEGKLQLFFE